MAIEILFFGSLADITATDKLYIEPLKELSAVKNQLHQQFPAFQGAAYFISVNRQMVQDELALSDGDCIAFMPPYSGG